MRRFLGVVVLFLVVAARAAWCQPLPADPRLTTGECENGLRYVVVRHPMPPQRAQVWLHVNAGTLNETDAQRGAAHFVSHLAFAGSENLTPEGIETLLNTLGIRAGADLNSFTGYVESVYKLSPRDASPDSISKSLGLLAEIAQRLTFPGADVEKERTAILAEQKNTVKVEQRIQEFLMAHLAPGSFLGDRTRLGTPASISGITPDDLRAFYKRWYVPSNMTVIVVADADPATIVPLIESSLGKGAKVAAPVRPDPGVKGYTASNAAVVSDADLNTSRVYCFHPAPLDAPVRTVEDLRRRVLDSLAVGAFNRRLSTKLSVGKIPLQEAGAFSSDLAGVCQLTGMYATAENGDWKGAMKAMGEEIQRARLHGLFKSEVEETKKQFLTQAEQNVKNDTLRQAAAYASALSATVGNGDVLISAAETLEQLKGITASLDEAAVSQRFKELMDPAAVLYMLALPSGGLTPTEAEVLAAGEEAMKATPAAEEEYIKPTALMTTIPTPGKVLEESMHEASGVWSGWLDNGALVHYKAMDVSPGQATITVAVAGGVIEEDDVTRGFTEAGSVAWSRPATSTLPSYAIQELTREKKIQLGGGPGVDNLLLAVTGPVDELETGMQLVHLLLTDPVIEPPALEQWKKTQIAAAEARPTEPRDVFNDAMLDMIYAPEETRPRSLSKAQVEHVTLEGAQAWLRRVLAAGPVEVSVVGDIPKDRALQLVTTYVGSLPKRERISASTMDSRRAAKHSTGPRTAVREVQGLADASFIMAGFLGADAEDLHDTRLLGLAAQILTARMSRTVQAAEHLVQNVAVQSQPGQEFPGFGVFAAFAPADSAKADAAVKRIFESFAEFAKAGPSVEELTEAKDQITHQLESAMAKPQFWSGQLSLLQYRGLKLDDLAAALEPYRSVTPEDVRAAFAKYYREESKMQLLLVQKAPEKTPAGPAAPGAAATPGGNK